MSQKNTGFDAFFTVLTSSPEYKNYMNPDKKSPPIEPIKKIITQDSTNSREKAEKDLLEQKDEVAKASSIFDQMNSFFATPEAIENGNKYSSQKSEVETKGTMQIQAQYFEKTNPLTWGFLGVAGMEKLKKELTDSFISPLKFKFFIQKLKAQGTENMDEKTKSYISLYENYEKFGVSIPTGLMFYGPPGTGKTYITKKLAEELEAGIIIKTVGEFGSSYMHQTSKNIKDFFAQAKELSKKGPIILFLDEIDSLVSKRTNQVDSNKAEEVSQFLQEINNLKDAQNLILVGATNRPDHLDSAIMRSGRFDKKIYIGPPDKEARKELFKIFIEKTNRPHENLNYEELALLTEGYVSSDIQAICDEAARDASKSILDFMTLVQNDMKNQDIESFQKNIHAHVINMEILIQAIKDTTSSLKMVDMGVYENWEKTLES